ncbi:MAG: hypothetical protein K6B52_06225 [Clostridiales bacterium]|nr:hypothetical protein [Clostridiales bacterium]
MRKRILNYTKEIEKLLNGETAVNDWEEVIKDHLIQVGFFQHERLIHLIVTVLFAILTFMSLMLAMITEKLEVFILVLLLLVLLVPYIMHYYILENKVQQMYRQYDRMLEKLKQNKE